MADLLALTISSGEEVPLEICIRCFNDGSFGEIWGFIIFEIPRPVKRASRIEISSRRIIFNFPFSYVIFFSFLEYQNYYSIVVNYYSFRISFSPNFPRDAEKGGV